MRRVPDILVRDVPKRIHDALKRRARRNGRSVNAELLEVLEDVAREEVDAREIAAQMRELAKRLSLPPEIAQRNWVKEGREERTRKQAKLYGF